MVVLAWGWVGVRTRPSPVWRWAFGCDGTEPLVTQTSLRKHTGLLAMDRCQYSVRLGYGALWVFLLQSGVLPGAQSSLRSLRRCVLLVKWAFTLPERKFDAVGELKWVQSSQERLLLVKCWVSWVKPTLLPSVLRGFIHLLILPSGNRECYLF